MRQHDPGANTVTTNIHPDDENNALINGNGTGNGNGHLAGGYYYF
jgi:hypothetical protein